MRVCLPEVNEPTLRRCWEVPDVNSAADRQPSVGNADIGSPLLMSADKAAGV